MSKTFDLKTLNLSAGTHEITVKARAVGRPDSEPSIAVSYTVAGDAETVSGTWYFNEIPTVLKNEQRVLFTSNGRQFYGIVGRNDVQTDLGYRKTEAISSINVYDDVYVSPINNPNNYGWTNEAYRTITFDGVQEVSKEFYDWLVANAVQQTIGFTIDGTQYFAEPGMTWGEWVNSGYDNGLFELDEYNAVKLKSGSLWVEFSRQGQCVYKDEIIVVYDYALGK